MSLDINFYTVSDLTNEQIAAIEAANTYEDLESIHGLNVVFLADGAPINLVSSLEDFWKEKVINNQSFYCINMQNIAHFRNQERLLEEVHEVFFGNGVRCEDCGFYPIDVDDLKGLKYLIFDLEYEDNGLAELLNDPYASDEYLNIFYHEWW